MAKKLNQEKSIFFVGIGGAGMSGLARVLLARNYKIEGSDLRDSFQTKHLQSHGAKVHIPHNQKNIHDQIQVMVRSTAIKDTNPEIIQASKYNIPIWHRSEMLAYLVTDKKLLAVAGTHGKTTTSSLLTSVFQHCEQDPVVFLGAEFDEIQGNAKDGSGQYAIIEADESDGSFLNYQPYGSIITNIDEDHLNFYRDLSHIQEYFIRFLKNHHPDGYSILCGDDPGIIAIKEEIKALPIRTYFYGTEKDNDFVIKNIKTDIAETTYEIWKDDQKIQQCQIIVHGMHNVYNATAAFVTSYIEKLDLPQAGKALSSFRGPQRRFQVKSEINNILVIDDYGHHPQEIECTLKAAQNLKKLRGGKLFTIFQPHRYSRTAKLLDRFSESFSNTDTLLLMDVYSASEEDIYGVNSETLLNKIKLSGYEPSYLTLTHSHENTIQYLWNHLEPKDTVLTIGAGDVYKVGDQLINRLRDGECK